MTQTKSDKSCCIRLSAKARSEAKELAELMGIKFGAKFSTKTALEMLIQQELTAMNHQVSKSRACL